MIPRKGNCYFLIQSPLLRPSILSMNDTAQPITPREKEVLQLLSKGLTYEKIAKHLNVSHQTVKMHLKNIYRKLGVQNKIEALNKFRLL